MYNDQVTTFLDEYVGNTKIKTQGQYAGWSMPDENVVIMSEFPGKDNMAPIYIIHLSKPMIYEYIDLQNEKDRKVKEKASNAFDSAF